MGMNLFIHPLYPATKLKPVPPNLELDEQYSYLPRFVGSGDFWVALINNGQHNWVHGCDGPTDSSCKHRCDPESAWRPLDLVGLRESTKEMQPIFQTLIDYLEAEPNAWITYS